MVTTFRASPEPPGPPQQEPPRTTRTRYEGKGPVPAVCLATVTVMAARKERRRSDRKCGVSWFAHLLENLLIRARRWPCR